ncbi:MAG: hypothetical protein Q8K50_20815 [Hydrogenophaga sp.]|nr:hypothetical protein [Hydrogenophaga sp.]
MKFFIFDYRLSGRSIVKDLAHGASTLVDLGGTNFRYSEVLPKYNPKDPFADDLAVIASDFAKVMQAPEKLEGSRK